MIFRFGANKIKFKMSITVKLAIFMIALMGFFCPNSLQAGTFNTPANRSEINIFGSIYSYNFEAKAHHIEKALHTIVLIYQGLTDNSGEVNIPVTWEDDGCPILITLQLVTLDGQIIAEKITTDLTVDFTDINVINGNYLLVVKSSDFQIEQLIKVNR